MFCFQVVLIIGITGACRRQELLNLKVNDIEDLGEFMKYYVADH
jgi:ribosome biogenesis protein Nip4